MMAVHALAVDMPVRYVVTAKRLGIITVRAMLTDTPVRQVSGKMVNKLYS